MAFSLSPLLPTFVTLALVTSPLAAASQQDSASAGAQICSEICIIEKSQDYLIEITSGDRPDWASSILTEMPPYAVCGVRVISQSGITLYEDFDETDRAFDQAFVECADERKLLDDTVREKLLDDGVFATAQQADAQTVPLRAMLFGVRMSDIFDAGGLGSPADRYAQSRFPDFYNGFLNRGGSSNAPPVQPQ